MCAVRLKTLMESGSVVKTMLRGLNAKSSATRAINQSTVVGESANAKFTKVRADWLNSKVKFNP